jgi:CRP-like cAMP-binding protein
MNFSLDNFLKSGKRIEYNKNEYILKQGSISRCTYFVIEGVVRHYVLDYSGNDKTIRISKENDFFFSSNISYWNGESSYINCQSLLNTKLLYWTKDELDNLSAIQPEFLEFMNDKLIEFIIEKHKKEISRITKNAEERLIEFNEENINLFNRIPHHIIASYLDMTPETLSRLRAKFKKQKS